MIIKSKSEGNETMKVQKRVATTIAVVLASVLLVTGCSGNPSEGPTSGPVKENTTVIPDKAEPTKISVMVTLHTAEVPSETLKKILEEKTNTQLDITFVPNGVYEEKFQTGLATGSLPQMAYVGNLNSFMNIRSAIKDDQFWEIGPYLKDYPNLSKLNPNVLNNMKIGGKLYTLYQELPLSRQGVIYRKDWADKLGLSAPKSTDDIYNMLKKFKEAGLTSIPLADRNELIYGAFKTFSSYFGTPNNWGIVNGELVPEFMTQGYMDTMKFIKKLRDEGLINQDFPVTSKNDQLNLVISGKSGMYIGSMSGVDAFEDQVQANVKEAKLDVENRIVGANGKLGVWAVPGYGSPVLFPKSSIKTEDELKRILAFSDKMYDPEIANLLMYGVEGTHYTLKDNKVAPVGDKKLLDKDVGGYSGFALRRETNIMPKAYAKPLGEKIAQLTNEATAFAISDPAAPLESKTYTEKGARLQTIITDATYKFMMGNIDENGFKAAIEKWKNDGGAQVIEEYNQAYKAAGGK
jgi:putative aldouronate transport system substrate-binding protein